MDAKNKITYFSAYTFCLILPLLILGGCFRHEISLWQDWPIYVPFLVIGIFASFGNARTRNLAFLFQMPVFLQLLFTTLFFRLLVLEESYHVVISTFVYCALFVTWHAFSQPTVSAWQMLRTIYLSLIFTHAVLYAYCTICYDTSWSEYLHSSGWQISSDISQFIGLFFTALFCQAKPYTPKWLLWFGCLCLCPFIGGFYLSPTIFHKLQYGTFTGKEQEPATLVVRSSTGNERKMPQEYQVLLISRNLDIHEMQTFERLAVLVPNQAVQFSILGIYDSPQTIKTLLRQHRTLHLKMPLYFMKEASWQKSPLKAHTDKDYLCVFKNGTLIYKGDMPQPNNAIHSLFKETQQ